jgi:osmoprotectant transport system ATP-binding protein
MSVAVLEANEVSKIYPGPVRALNGASLTVEAGETMVLVGESGSGKSTLLRMFNRMADPTSGRIRIRSRHATDWDPIDLRRSVGYVQQEGGLLPHWTVARNVALVPRLLKWTRNRQDRQVNDLLDLVGMDAPRFRDRYPNELSGGQRQRVAFARALAADPDVLLMDEPFGALDAITRLELRGEFLRLKARLRKTMLLVTHDLAEAFRLGDRIAVMKEGRILQTGSPAELEAAPAHEYVTKLLRHAREESP